MAETDISEALRAARPRPACSDAERRLTRQITAGLIDHRPQTSTDTFWMHRGATAFALLFAAAGLVGSVVGTRHATEGAVITGIALVALLLDAGARVRPWRWFVPARATQVVSAPPDRAPGRGAIDLLIAVRADVPTCGMGDRGRLALHGVGPERVAAVGLALVTAACGARIAGALGLGVNVAQAVPTLLLVVACAALIDRALAGAPRPVDADGADGAVQAAVNLLAALDAQPPRRLAPTLVICGAGAMSMRRFLRAQRRAGVTARDVAVVELRAAAGEHPVWWRSDGVVWPLRSHPTLLATAAQVAADETHLGARAVRGASSSPARAARGLRFPSIALGVPAHGEAGLEFALAVVRQLDTSLNA